MASPEPMEDVSFDAQGTVHKRRLSLSESPSSSPSSKKIRSSSLIRTDKGEVVFKNKEDNSATVNDNQSNDGDYTASVDSHSNKPRPPPLNPTAGLPECPAESSQPDTTNLSASPSAIFHPTAGSTVDSGLTNKCQQITSQLMGMESVGLHGQAVDASVRASLTPHPPPANKSVIGFADLPSNVKERILSYLIPTNEVIIPTYRQGLLKHGPFSNPLNDVDVSFEPNIDYTLFLVNCDFATHASNVLYGTNIFKFKRAEVCNWWIRNIKETNFSKIRKLVLELGHGFTTHNPQFRSSMELSQEEGWLQNLNWIFSRHKLQMLKISFVGWNLPLCEEKLDEDERSHIIKCRLKTVERLRLYRGIKCPIFANVNCYFLDAKESDCLTTWMQLPETKEEKKAREDWNSMVKKLPLSQVFSLLHQERVAAEMQAEIDGGG